VNEALLESFLVRTTKKLLPGPLEFF